MVNLSFLTPTAFAFLGSTSTSSSCRKRPFLHMHSSVTSPYTATAIATTSSSSSDGSLQELCRLLGVTPLDLIRLESTQEERGVYLNKEVKEGDLIVKVPLAACLLDDEPPEWWNKEESSDDQFAYSNPSDWAPRLAASLLELQLNPEANNDIAKGQQLWLSYLPNSDQLRASLPVHWSEEVLSSARCTALELAVDSAYFARAEAIGDLTVGLQQQLDPKEDTALLCQNALDVVQTRSCRVEPLPEAPLRVLAPLFDLINHGSSTTSGEGSANAEFGLEGDCLCVRATQNIPADEEVLMDYGDSAKPAWKCLLSYGFVPHYGEEIEDEDEEEGENVAELFLEGHRYEVGPSTIPYDLVSACTAPEEEEPQLTPEIALKLAKRISEVSFWLLLDDKKKQRQKEEEEDAEVPEEGEDIEKLISLQRAASLRWSQHRILQACAKGLREWAS